MDMPGQMPQEAQDPNAKMMECVAKIEAALAVLKQELGAEEKGEMPGMPAQAMQQGFSKARGKPY